MNEDKTNSALTDKKEVKEVKEVATPRTIRVTQSVFDEMRETFDSIGAKNQTVGLKTILEGYKSACAINASTGTDQDALESVMTAVATITDEVRVLLDRKAQVQSAAELAVRSQMESKDKALFDLQKKYDELKKTSDQQKAQIAEMKPVVEKVDRFQAERDKANSDAEKAIKEADQIKSKLTDTIAYQSTQIKELQEKVKSFPVTEKQDGALERENERLQDRLKMEEDRVGELKKQLSELQNSLKEERDLREKEKAESMMNTARLSEDARQEKEAAVEKAQEKESLRWQTQIDKLENRLEEERKSHAKDLEELSRIRLEKEFKTDPEMEELRKTVETLKGELEKLKLNKN